MYIDARMRARSHKTVLEVSRLLNYLQDPNPELRFWARGLETSTPDVPSILPEV